MGRGRGVTTDIEAVALSAQSFHASAPQNQPPRISPQNQPPESATQKKPVPPRTSKPKEPAPQPSEWGRGNLDLSPPSTLSKSVAKGVTYFAKDAPWCIGMQ